VLNPCLLHRCSCLLSTVVSLSITTMIKADVQGIITLAGEQGDAEVPEIKAESLSREELATVVLVSFLLVSLAGNIYLLSRQPKRRALDQDGVGAVSDRLANSSSRVDRVRRLLDTERQNSAERERLATRVKAIKDRIALSLRINLNELASDLPELKKQPRELVHLVTKTGADERETETVWLGKDVVKSETETEASSVVSSVEADAVEKASEPLEEAAAVVWHPMLEHEPTTAASETESKTTEQAFTPVETGNKALRLASPVETENKALRLASTEDVLSRIDETISSVSTYEDSKGTTKASEAGVPQATQLRPTNAALRTDESNTGTTTKDSETKVQAVVSPSSKENQEPITTETSESGAEETSESGAEETQAAGAEETQAAGLGSSEVVLSSDQSKITVKEAEGVSSTSKESKTTNISDTGAEETEAIWLGSQNVVLSCDETHATRMVPETTTKEVAEEDDLSCDDLSSDDLSSSEESYVTMKTTEGEAARKAIWLTSATTAKVVWNNDESSPIKIPASLTEDTEEMDDMSFVTTRTCGTVEDREAVWLGSNDVVLSNDVPETRVCERLNCVPLTSGIHIWSILVEEADEAVWIGVTCTSLPSNHDESLGEPAAGWFYGSNGEGGATAHGPKNETQIDWGHPPFVEDSTVTFILDLTGNGTLSASIDSNPAFLLCSDMLANYDNTPEFVPTACLVSGKVRFLGFDPSSTTRMTSL
jgi:hypothetical protein